MSGVVIFLEPKGTMMEVVRGAKERGFIVVALITDPALLQSLPSPYDSALPCIDAIYPTESWNNTEQVLSIAEGVFSEHGSVAGVFSGIDPCAVPCARLRERFHLPTPAPEALQLILDKHRLRSRLNELGLSKLQTFHSSVVDAWDTWEICRPAYFKPVHGAFSMYVERCESLADLERAKRKWREGDDLVPKFISDYLQSTPEYHIEEAFDGELMSVEAILFNRRFHYIGLTSRILYSKNPTVEMGSCFPYPHPLADKIVGLVKEAHSKLGFTDGPTHTEVIVNSEGEVEIIDLNPRFIGADVLQSINHAYGIHVESALLDWALGIEPAIEPTQAYYSCIQYLLPPHQLLFDSIEFPNVPEVKFHTTFIKKGTMVADIDRQIDYLGCYLTVMPTFESALNRSRELRSQVLINKTLQAAY